MRGPDGKMTLLSPSKVTVTKLDGRTFRDVDAQISPESILFNDPALPLEAGDIIRRSLPSGLSEEFEITEPTFYEGLRTIPAFIDAKHRPVKRLPDHAKERQMNVTYNLHGANTRVNIQSSDNSININANEQSVFEEMRRMIMEQVPEAERSVLIASVDNMEGDANTPNFRDSYLKFVGAAADHLGVLSPFLPLLAQMLHR